MAVARSNAQSNKRENPCHGQCDYRQGVNGPQHTVGVEAE